MKILTALLTLGLLAGSARTQIDTTEYFPLGVFNQWRLVQSDDPTDTTFVKVTKVNLNDGVLRYTVITPFFDTATKVKLVMGVTDAGDWNLYRLGLIAPEIADEIDDAKLMTFDPPVKLGDTSTTVDGAPFVTPVNTSFEVKVEIGPLDAKIDVDVAGTISSGFTAIGSALDTPAGTFPANEQVGWNFDLNLNFTSPDTDELDEDVDVDGFMRLHQGTGIILATDPGSSNHVLDAAILPGTTVGGAFLPPGTVITAAGVDTPGLFVVGGQAASETTGGDFQITDIELVQELNGNVTLFGTVSSFLGSPSTDIELKGKSKVNSKTGAGKLTLKGKTKDLGTEKPVAFKANAVITGETTSIDIAYKSGPEIAGVMNLGLDPVVIDDVDLTINPLVDTKFEIKGTRILGAEGELTLNGSGGEMIVYPITLLEKRKAKEGFPDKHSYVVTQTGLKKKVMTSKAVSTGPEDFILLKFAGKLFGFKIKPEDLGDVAITVEDADD